MRSRKAAKDELHASRKAATIEMRRAGATFDEIGQAIGISMQAAHKIYRSALKDVYRKAATEERETALLRCDGMIRRWWPDLRSKDGAVADRAHRNLMSVMSFQADLWGMKRHDVDIHLDASLRMPTDAEVWQTLENYRQAAMRADAEEAAAEQPQPVLDVVDAVVIEHSHTNGHGPNGATP
jgi:hypothetical protein